MDRERERGAVKDRDEETEKNNRGNNGRRRRRRRKGQVGAGAPGGRLSYLSANLSGFLGHSHTPLYVSQRPLRLL